MLKKNINKLKLLVGITSIFLTACGGGGGDSGGGSTPTDGGNPPSKTEPITPVNIDFYTAAQITSLSPYFPKSNNKNLTVSDTNYIGLYAEQVGKVSNNADGTINVVSGVGIYAFGSGSSGHNYGTINEKSTMGQDAYGMISNSGAAIYNESTGTINVVNQVGMRSVGLASTAINRGRINITGTGLGISTMGGTALNDVSGIITGTTGTGIYVAEAYDGTKWVGGKGINKGEITMTGDGAWGMFSQFGDITNEASATITMNGDNAIAMYVSGTGVATNNGTIILTGDNATGIYAQGWENSVSGINNGIIDMTNATNSTGIHVSGGTYINNGTIKLGPSGNNDGVNNDGDISPFSLGASNGNHNFLLENGASLLNAGEIVSNNSTFDTNDMGNGHFIMTKNGFLSADNVIGDIYVDGVGIADIYSKNAVEENAISSTNLDINILSESPMYNVSYSNNNLRSSSYDINVERKNFNEVMENGAYSSFLENNIFDSNNSFKDDVYKSLLGSTSISGLNDAFDKVIGNKVFPTIQKINYTQLSDRNNHINDIAYKDSFGESFENNDVAFFGDFSYSYIDSNSTSSMRGYTENRDTVLLGAHAPLNSSMRIGSALSVGASKVSFQGESSTLDNKIAHLAPFILYKNLDYNLVLSPYFGYIDGDLTRDLGLESREDSNMSTYYYGIYSEINREFKFDEFYTKPRFEVNGAFFNQKILEESGDRGVNIPETDYNTFTTGVGSSIGKKFDFSNGYSLTVELDGAYYHEFGNPNNNFDGITLEGFNGETTLNSYSYSRDYGKVGAEVSLSRNNVYGYAKYQYIIGQNTDVQKTTLGISYKF